MGGWVGGGCACACVCAGVPIHAFGGNHSGEGGTDRARGGETNRESVRKTSDGRGARGEGGNRILLTLLGTNSACSSACDREAGYQLWSRSWISGLKSLSVELCSLVDLNELVLFENRLYVHGCEIHICDLSWVWTCLILHVRLSKFVNFLSVRLL